MRSLTEILLPTDFSAPSADVARYAAVVAQHFKSKITLLHVLVPINPAWLTGANSAVIDEIFADQKAKASERLNRFLAQELRDATVERIVSEGDPADVITRYCTSGAVGLIMMPTRGCSAFRRFLLGSVTAKVLHDVSCPVWTSSHVSNGRSSASVIPNVIVCAIDPASRGQEILNWAADLSAELQARLIVSHAIPSLEFHPETYYLEADMRAALIREARAKISKVLQGTRMPGAEIRVDGGSVSTVVRSTVEDAPADLLIIGRASNKGMLGRLRTHSYALIRESPCPVISI